MNPTPAGLSAADPLSDAERRFREHLLSQIHDAVVATDLDERVTYWNAGAERLFGIPAGQAVGKHQHEVYQYLWPNDGARQAASDALATAGIWSGDNLVNASSGVRWVASVVSVLHDMHGVRDGYLVTLRDVTGRKRLEVERDRARAALNAIESERAATLAQITDGVILSDAEGRITYVNEAARRIHGVSTLGVSVESYSASYHLLTMDGEPYPPNELPLARAVERGESVRDAQWRIRRPDGSEIVAEGSATPIMGANGAPIGAALVVRDVSARHALERERDAFLASTSHDLRNPLAAIKGTAQVLRRLLRRGDAIPPERLLAGLESIDRSVNQLNDQIGSLLDVARFRMGQQLDLYRQPANLVALAREVVTQYQHVSEVHQLRLEADDAEILGNWDTERLRRTLGNLLGNALKYSPEGSEVTIEVSRDSDGWAVVSVHDQGIGIPAADLPHVFERFRRGANVAGQIIGTGIGLADVRQVVEAHGGTVDVQSTEGAGSTFTLRLPPATPEDAS